MELRTLFHSWTHFRIVKKVFQAFKEVEAIRDNLGGVDHRYKRCLLKKRREFVLLVFWQPDNFVEDELQGRWIAL